MRGYLTLAVALGFCQGGADMSCANSVAFCRIQMRACDHIGDEANCPFHCEDNTQVKGRVPDIDLVRELYIQFHGGNLSHHCKSVIMELNRFLRESGLKGSDPIDAITYDVIERYISKFNIRNISKIGICYRLQSLLGRRERLAYRKHGFDVRPVDTPAIDDDTRAYASATEERVLRILEWYRALQFDQDQRKRIFAMLMFRYAMRNGDVARLRWRNFIVSGGKWQLNYIPHKTEKSTAGRSVKIWLNAADQVELANFRGSAKDDDFVIRRIGRGRALRRIQDELNDSLRAIGLTGSKGLYELRKMCIDRVYHLVGAEAASAYSGDDFKTIKFHYCDTSSMNLHGIGDDAFGSAK